MQNQNNAPEYHFLDLVKICEHYNRKTLLIKTLDGIFEFPAILSVFVNFKVWIKWTDFITENTPHGMLDISRNLTEADNPFIDAFIDDIKNGRLDVEQFFEQPKNPYWSK